MADDLSSASVFEKRRERFLALAEKSRVRAATASNEELAHGYARLAIGYEKLAEGCERLARQAIRHSIWESFPFLTSRPRRIDEQCGNYPF
jgi:hypothetical protein